MPASPVRPTSVTRRPGKDGLSLALLAPAFKGALLAETSSGGAESEAAVVGGSKLNARGSNSKRWALTPPFIYGHSHMNKYGQRYEQIWTNI